MNLPLSRRPRWARRGRATRPLALPAFQQFGEGELVQGGEPEWACTCGLSQTRPHRERSFNFSSSSGQARVVQSS